MRKITILFIFFALMLTGDLFSVKVFKFQDNLTSTPLANWGFNSTIGGTITYDAVNKLMSFRWGLNSSGTRALSESITMGQDNKITIEIILKFYTSSVSSNVGALYFLDNSDKPITGVAFWRNSTQWRIGRTTSYTGPGNPSTTPSVSDWLAADRPTAKLIFVLNMFDKTLNFTAQNGTFNNETRVFTPSGASVTSSSQPFINTDAVDFRKFYMNYRRASTTGAEINGFDLFYFGISREEVASTANVTVRFKDQNNEYFKSDEVIADQVVGNPYNSTISQRTSVQSDGFYYTLDPSSPISVESVVEGGSTLILNFRKSPYFSTSVWNGTTETNGNSWSEWYENFINGAIGIGYQKNATVTFSETAVNKSVVLNDAIDMGTGNVIISSPDYVFSGSGSFSGSGAMNINLSGSDNLTLGVTNSLGLTTQISGGNITLNKSGVLGSATNITGAATLNLGASSVTIPVTTFGTSSIINVGNYSSSLINGMTAGNGVKVTVNAGVNHASNDNTRAFDFAATGTLSAGSEIELNGTGTDNRIGMTTASTGYLANTKLSLKGAAMFYINVNQGAATTINVGSLSGESGTRLGWGRSADLARHITWSVGASNQDSEFAGTITNLGGYGTSGNSYTGNYTHLTKVGTGRLTLSGTSDSYNGNLTVNGGEMVISGTHRGNNQAVTPLTNTVSVAADAKLTVSGSLTATNLVLNSNASGTATLVNTGTVNASATVNQYLSTGRNWYITPPVAGATAATLLGSASKVYKYSEPLADWVEVPSGEVLEAGRGYITQSTSTGNVQFSGSLNDGEKIISLSRSALKQGTELANPKPGFNLIGNPYPSYLNAMSAINANANVEKTIWYRTKGASYQFETVNTASGEGTNIAGTGRVTGYVPPMQAFWVRTGVDNQTITFTNAMRTHANPVVEEETVGTTLLKAPAIKNRLLRLEVSNGINKDEAILYFNANASDGFDDYDSRKMFNNNVAVPELYSIVENEQLVINGMNDYSFNTIVPLIFKTGQANTFTLKASELRSFDEDTRIFLYDDLTKSQTDLTEGGSYSFASDVTTGSDRFSIQFKSANGTTSSDFYTSGVKVYSAGNRIFIEGAVGGATIEVYNAVGQRIHAEVPATNSTSLSRNFLKGMYVVRVNLGTSDQSAKVIIR